jgi:sugar/nucleoside kinase (ribokinase family)
VVVVTDGAAGYHIAALGQLHCVPPCWTEAPPVDSCGAGDAYAAGLIYAYLRGCDVVAMGRTAARVASAVIAKQGSMLSAEAAAALVDALPRSASRRSLAPAALAPSTPAA